MYNWSPVEHTLEELNKIPINKAIKTAEKFVIKPGDLYFMPWDKFHIGYTKDFSIGITLWFNNPTKFSVLTKLFNNVVINNLLDSEKILFSQLNREINNEDSFSEKVLALDEFKQASLSETLYHSHLDEKNKLLSNGNWNSKSLILLTLNFSSGDLNKVIKIVEPYKIFHQIIGDRISIYYRGHKIVISFSQLIISILDQLNNLIPLTLSDIIQIMLPQYTPRQTIIFFTEMYQKQAVCLV